MKIKIFSLIIVFVLVVAFVFYRSNLNQEVPQSEYDIPQTFDDGFVPKLKVPENTFFLGAKGLLEMEFKTTKSKSEIIKFYDEYFSDLQFVYSNGQRSDEIDYFYDKDQRMVFFDVEVFEYDDYNIFYIGCDPCENILESEAWTIIKPE